MCALWAGAGTAQQAQVVNPALAETRAVVFCHNLPFDTTAAPGTEAGRIAKPRNMPKLIAGAGQQVPAVLNMGFGVIAQAAGQTISVAKIKVFKPGATRPDTWDTRFRVGHQTFDYWYFGSLDQMVLGDWRIEAIKGDRVLYRVAFEVARPAQLPKLAKACD